MHTRIIPPRIVRSFWFSRAFLSQASYISLYARFFIFSIDRNSAIRRDSPPRKLLLSRFANLTSLANKRHSTCSGRSLFVWRIKTGVEGAISLRQFFRGFFTSIRHRYRYDDDVISNGQSAKPEEHCATHTFWRATLRYLTTIVRRAKSYSSLWALLLTVWRNRENTIS